MARKSETSQQPTRSCKTTTVCNPCATLRHPGPGTLLSLLRLLSLEPLDCADRQCISWVNGLQALIAHEGQASNAKECVVHVSHVVRPVTDASIVLIL